MRPAFRYHGGKFALLPRLLPLTPSHRVAVDLFGGAANWILNKPRAPYMDVYNDRNGAVVTFFRTLRNREAELVRAIELTPYSRAEYNTAWRTLADGVEDELEHSRLFFTVAWQSRGKVATDRNGGFRAVTKPSSRHSPCVDDWSNTLANLRLVAARLRQIQIECLDFRDCVDRYDGADTLFYCDPPYLPASRKQSSGLHRYAHDLDEAGHEELLTILAGVAGKVILSGYDNPLYRDRLASWRRYDFNVQTDNQAGTATESVWLSPNCVERNLFTI